MFGSRLTTAGLSTLTFQVQPSPSWRRKRSPGCRVMVWPLSARVTVRLPDGAGVAFMVGVFSGARVGSGVAASAGMALVGLGVADGLGVAVEVDVAVAVGVPVSVLVGEAVAEAVAMGVDVAGDGVGGMVAWA